jgi:hypothetical protein
MGFSANTIANLKTNPLIVFKYFDKKTGRLLPPEQTKPNRNGVICKHYITHPASEKDIKKDKNKLELTEINGHYYLQIMKLMNDI